MFCGIPVVSKERLQWHKILCNLASAALLDVIVLRHFTVTVPLFSILLAAEKCLD